MYGSKHNSNVALFPLCDTRGVLIDALCETNDAPATRGDALVFAWRLELPKSIKVADAANSLLVVAMNVPRKQWTRQQLLIIRELMVLAGREGAVPHHSHAVLATQRRKPKSSTSVPRSRPNLDALRNVRPNTQPDDSTNTKSVQIKEDKQWWKLVGKPDPDDDPTDGAPTGSPSKKKGRRKTRTERVSRDPTNKLR